MTGRANGDKGSAGFCLIVPIGPILFLDGVGGIDS